MSDTRAVRFDGSVWLAYPRRWWQFRRPGWHRHVDGLGRSCWIRYNWTFEELEQLRQIEIAAPRAPVRVDDSD